MGTMFLSVFLNSYRCRLRLAWSFANAVTSSLNTEMSRSLKSSATGRVARYVAKTSVSFGLYYFCISAVRSPCGLKKICSSFD